MDPQTGRRTRLKMGYLSDGTRVRIAKKTGSVIEIPESKEEKEKREMREKGDGFLDTNQKKVLEITYKGEDFEKIKKEFDEYIKEKERTEKLLVFDD